MASKNDDRKHIEDLKKEYFIQQEEYLAKLEKESNRDHLDKQAVGPVSMRQNALQADKDQAAQKNQDKLKGFSKKLAERLFSDFGGSLEAVNKLLELKNISPEFNNSSLIKQEKLKQMQQEVREQWQKSQAKPEYEQNQAKKERLEKFKVQARNLAKEGDYQKRKAISLSKENQSIGRNLESPDKSTQMTEMVSKTAHTEKKAVDFSKEVKNLGSKSASEFQRLPDINNEKSK